MRAKAWKRPGADLEAEGSRGDVLELVGLVEDHQVVWRQQLAADGQGGRVQVGVDDHHVGLGGPVPGRLGEASSAGRAAGRARALPGPDADLGPGDRAGFPGQLGPVAGVRVAPPRSTSRRISRPSGPSRGG